MGLGEGEGPGGCLRGIGGGLNIFFRGRNSHQVISWTMVLQAGERTHESITLLHRKLPREFMCGGQSRVVFILHFLWFCSVRGSHDSQTLGKTAREVSLSHPSCVPQVLGLESSVSLCQQAKHGKNDRSTPFCSYTGNSFAVHYIVFM